MAQIVTKPDRLGENFIETKRLGDGATDLRDFQNVCEPRAVVITFRGQENLRLVLEAAKRLAVNDAIAIALIRRPKVVFRFVVIAAARVGALRRARSESIGLDLLEHLADVHCRIVSSMNFVPAIGLKRYGLIS